MKQMERASAAERAITMPNDPWSSEPQGREVNGAVRSSSRKRSDRPSLQNFSPEEIKDATDALTRITRFITYANIHRDELADIDYVHGRCVEQDREIQHLKEQISIIHTYRDYEIDQVRRENETYRSQQEEFEAKRRELEEKEIELEDDKANMQQKMDQERQQAQIKMDENFAKGRDRVREEATAKIAEVEEKKVKEIEKLQGKMQQLVNARQEIERAKEDQRENLMRQIQGLETTNRAQLAFIPDLERQIEVLTVVEGLVEQTVGF